LLAEVTTEAGVIDDRLLKTDYHGCVLRVASAPNPSQVGLSGIVVEESKHTFQLITRNDRLIGELTFDSVID